MVEARKVKVSELNRILHMARKTIKKEYLEEYIFLLSLEDTSYHHLITMQTLFDSDEVIIKFCELVSKKFPDKRALILKSIDKVTENIEVFLSLLYN